MAIKYERIKQGMVLFDVHKQKMGNTSMSRWGCWEVRIIVLLPTDHAAIVSWNGTPQQTWREHKLTRLYEKKPKKYTEQKGIFR